MLWKVASGVKPLPVSRVPFWIDVRDLATAHVEALTSANVGGKRYIPASPERFSYGIAAQIISGAFPDLKDGVTQENQAIDVSCGVDGETASKELGFTYRSFEDTVRDLISQVVLLNKS
jgi:nucleoside-diphosphate-sugar epimerase